MRTAADQARDRHAEGWSGQTPNQTSHPQRYGLNPFLHARKYAEVGPALPRDCEFSAHATRYLHSIKWMSSTQKSNSGLG
jgi:hypothetical protein